MLVDIEMIEERRPMNPDMDAIYILSPQPHIVDCLLADFERRRYRKSFLVWIALLDPQMRRRIDQSNNAQSQLGGFETLSIDYFPRESHLITFRDPWSFPILYHPACNHLVRDHMQTLAQKVGHVSNGLAGKTNMSSKITGICVSLGEYPKVRYYKPRNPTHKASVLCSHLARFVQEELDAYAQWNPNFPPPATRPQGVLLITDRTMDLMAPLVHEFTYQAMAHDLLPIKEGDKVLYKTVINAGEPDEEEKEMEIGEKDKIWVENRHSHMKDTIEKIMGDFNKFIEDNPHFTNSDADTTSLNAIKDMLAGLPQFQELKEAYSLHLNMAQECMNSFQANKLDDVASLEQSLATGLDEDFKKPKNLADQLVRLLDYDAISKPDRLRLIILYVLYRDGLIPDDIQRLLAHADLSPELMDSITNMELLGGRALKQLKDTKPPPLPLFVKKVNAADPDNEYALSRFEPAVKTMLEEGVKGTLDPQIFPYVKPPLDNGESEMLANQASLRSAKPTWARNRLSTLESRQRIIVFMAGGATYSELRSCYEVSKVSSRDIFLATSHMQTPSLFIRQVGDLSTDRRRLDIPAERPKPKAPAHLFEREEKPKPVALPPQPMGMGMGGPGSMGQMPISPPPPSVPAKGPAPPTAGLGAMTLNSGGARPVNGGAAPAPVLDKKGRLVKQPGEEKEKKKRHFFGSKRDK
jgi:syntaxin-binding protein 1